MDFTFIKKVNWINRVALFLVFFWFGVLKVLSLSPAEGLVTGLFDLTLSSFMEINVFLLLFGLFECVIGFLWLFPKYTKFAFYALVFHMATTFLPMILLRNDTWQSFLTLTLTGQYIVKNVVLLASALFVFEWDRINNQKVTSETESSLAMENEAVLQD